MNAEILENAVRNAPLSLLALKDSESISYVNDFLPYSVGFEIETDLQDDSNTNDFHNIPDIMYVGVDMWEQRFRIPNGIAGLLCLYNITVQLRKNLKLNHEAAIHYHIDMTDCFDQITDQFIKDNNDWMIEEVSTWGDNLDHDRSKKCSRERAWIRYANEHKTLEIRLGEMSFDYSVIINRMIHACSIVKRLKDKLQADAIVYSFFDPQRVIDYIKSINNESYILSGIDDLEDELRKISKGIKDDPDFTPEMFNTVKKRVIKLSP